MRGDVMRVAFLGSSGVIGSAIYNQLVQSHDITTFGRGGRYDVALDLFDPASITADQFRGFDALVHSAGVIDEDFVISPGAGYMKGTLAAKILMESALSAGVRHFVYISSAHVYGPLEGNIDERKNCAPLSDYAIAHYATEQILNRITRSGTGQVRALALRPCATYGLPRDMERFTRWSLVPFNLPRQAVLSRRITLYPGSDQVFRNFVGADSIGRHVEDFLRPSDITGFHVRNPLGEATLSIYDFARCCARVYQDLTGEVCSVEMSPAAPVSTLRPPLEYGSIHPEQPQGQSVDAYLREIMTQILATRSQNGIS